jgi:sporulation protein YlmC with PRC-barrel domain
MNFLSVRSIASATVTVIALVALPSLALAQTGPTVKFVGYQNAGEIRASNLSGVVVKNKAGDVVGDINDVVFQPNGQISVVILGVGGVLGVGEKNVAVAYSDITLTAGENGKRTATLDVTKAALESAPSYLGERTTFEKVEDGAASLATSAAQKAKELKDKMTAPAEPSATPK